jgi:hypothetical protein
MAIDKQLKARLESAKVIFLEELDELMQDGGMNRRIYEEFFRNNSDEYVIDLLKKVLNEEAWLKIYKPVGGPSKMTAYGNIKLARKWGIEIMQRLLIPASQALGTPAYLTPVRYMVGWIPTRRQSQLYIKKQSTAAGSGTTDIITGQAAGKDDAGRISNTELQKMAARGQFSAIYELNTLRGGDRGGFNALNAMLEQRGYAYSKSTEPYRTGVESTHSLSVYLTASHLKNNLVTGAALT